MTKRITARLLALMALLALTACGGDNDGVPGFTVGGRVAGLGAEKVILRNNGGEELVLSNASTFTFSQLLADGDDYDIVIVTQPDGHQYCKVSGGTGTVSGHNVDTVVIRCSQDYTVGGSVTGIEGTLVLRLREKLADCAQRNHFELFFPRQAFCTDNGAMIAYAGWARRAQGRPADAALFTTPRWPLADLRIPEAAV